jgi:hypothetical protein
MIQVVMICLTVYVMHESAILYCNIQLLCNFLEPGQHSYKKPEQSISYFQFCTHVNKNIHIYISYILTLSCSRITC